jgi:hypothetical protein
MKFIKNLSFLLFSFSLLCTLPMQAATDKYRCMWRDDPATTMVVAWNQISGQRPVLYYDTQNKGQQLQRYTYSQTPNYATKAKGMNNQFARLQNLKPNTVYYVLIADSEGCSQQLSFKTAPDQPTERLSVIAGGDSRNYREARRNANIMVSKLRAHVVLFAGDMTGGDSSKEWQQWLNDWQLTIAKDGRMTPILAARGNHERDNTSIHALFDSPNKDVYYAFTFAGGLLRTYTLNTLLPTGGEQKEWLEQDLNAHVDVQWKLAQYHHTMFPHTREKPEHWEMYKNWAPLFHDQRVDLVVESDAHVVKMTHPIRPSKGIGSDHGFVRDDETGTVYVGEGCWGAPLRGSNDDKKWTMASGSFNQFKLIFVDQSAIEVRTVLVDKAGSAASVPMYDSFQLPTDFPLWQQPEGGVLRIANKQLLAMQAPQKEVVQASVPPAVSPIREPTPLANKKLYANASGAVNVRYELNGEGEVEMNLLNKKMQRVRRSTYLHVNGGTFVEPFQLNGIPKGTYLLILKSGGEVIEKYEIIKK